MRFPRLMLAAAGLATVALLGSSAAANAASTSTINGPFTNFAEAGYQVQSSVSFNEVRTTVHIPAGSATSSFIALQANGNGGQTFAIGLQNIGGSYFLVGTKGFQFNTQTGVPLGPSIAPQLEFLSSIGAPAHTPLFSAGDGGSYYIEVHYSTSERLAQYVAGPSETDAATLATTGPTFHFQHNITFNAPRSRPSTSRAGTCRSRPRRRPSPGPVSLSRPAPTSAASPAPA